MMTSLRDKVLDILRHDEDTAFRAAGPAPEGSRECCVVTHVAREIFKVIETPPTRHHNFVVRTMFDIDGQAKRHSIYVRVRGGQRYRQVIHDRPGVFGG